MKVLVIGANGFLGRNLSVALKRAGREVALVDRESTPEAWASGARDAAVVFHVAGACRPMNDAEMRAGNIKPVAMLIDAIEQSRMSGSGAPAIVLASSTQAATTTPYGRAKLEAEELLETYSRRTGTPVVIYRMPGVFGKWCRPHYNSVVATFCHSIARDLPVTIHERDRRIDLVHVDDVVGSFLAHVEPAGRPAAGIARPVVGPIFTLTLGELLAQIQAFRAMRDSHRTPDTSDAFVRRLFGTYMSYLPPSELSRTLVRREDARGTLAEVLVSDQAGQAFVSRTRPGVTRGNHYHDLKVERFCVLEGEALIRLRPVGAGGVIEHRVRGVDFTTVDIPPGMTHSIENIGSGDLVVLFWASEVLDLRRPDTHPMDVLDD